MQAHLTQTGFVEPQSQGCHSATGVAVLGTDRRRVGLCCTCGQIVHCFMLVWWPFQQPGPAARLSTSSHELCD